MSHPHLSWILDSDLNWKLCWPNVQLQAQHLFEIIISFNPMPVWFDPNTNGTFNSIPCTFSLTCGPSKQTRWAVDKAMYLKMNNHSLWDQGVILLLLLLGETERYICTCPPSDDMGNWERLFSIPLSLWYFYDGSVYLWYICAWPRSKRGGVTTLLFSFLMAVSVTWALDLIRKKYLLSWSTGSNELPLFRNNNTV